MRVRSFEAKKKEDRFFFRRVQNKEFFLKRHTTETLIHTHVYPKPHKTSAMTQKEKKNNAFEYEWF